MWKGLERENATEERRFEGEARAARIMRVGCEEE
jgi:hypothetical protein